MTDKSKGTGSILVTGAAGLIGSAVVRRLAAQGKRVVAWDNFSIGSWRGTDVTGGEIIWCDGDIGDEKILSSMGGLGVDAVIHAAAHPGGLSLVEPSEDVRVNAAASMKLFEWCARNHASITYLSSSVIYGTDHPATPIREDAPLVPGTVYGACKVACENFLAILGRGYDLKWTVLRLFSTYGPGHKLSGFQGIVNVMLAQLIKGNRVVVKGSPDRVRDLVFVEDAANAIALSVANKGAAGQIMNVATGVPVTIRQLIFALAKACNRDSKQIEIVEEPGTVGDPQYNVADCTKAARVLGYQPEWCIDRGLEAYVKALRQKGLMP